MSSDKNASLYGIQRPKKAADKEITSSTNLAFTSQLSSLIASGSSSKPSSAGRPRPKGKDDIFSVHNKNARKRALKDLNDTDFTQRHSTSSEALDGATWKRSRRKMEEKARLYAAMKRGDVEDADERYAVDFDRKWAEKHDEGEESDTSSDEGVGSEPEELVEYVDEFGRTRRGTRADIAREERRKKSMLDEPDRFTARPAMPTNIIYGDTIQTAAFNPDETIAEKMAEIAAKREDTPPKDTHFDGGAEIRNKGTGFFQFSQDEEERQRQMEELERERLETERRRAERDRKKDDRKKEVEERRKALKQKRSKAQADKFLDGLMGELGDGAAEETPDPEGKEEGEATAE